MRLLLDLGNTRLKWARADGHCVGSAVGVCHADGLERVFSAWSELPRPSTVLGVSVAGVAIEGAIREWVAQRWDLPLRLLRASAQSNGIVNAYREPERLGADRWAAVLGAATRGPGACVVVDCGSAVTLDSVEAGGRHRGGLILPGLGLMRRTLHQGTARLPLAERAEASLFGADTESAIGSGTLLGLAAAVDSLAAAMASELSGPTRLWLSGGDAPTLKPYLRAGFEHVPDLVLEGLAVAESAWR